VCSARLKPTPKTLGVTLKSPPNTPIKFPLSPMALAEGRSFTYAGEGLFSSVGSSLHQGSISKLFSYRIASLKTFEISTLIPFQT